jgi:hypothetical protein
MVCFAIPPPRPPSDAPPPGFLRRYWLALVLALVLLGLGFQLVRLAQPLRTATQRPPALALRFQHLATGHIVPPARH